MADVDRTLLRENLKLTFEQPKSIYARCKWLRSCGAQVKS